MRWRPFAVVFALLSASAFAQSSFVNWETPTVHPLDMTPDGTKLLAVNLADARLMVYDITSGAPQPIGSVPVGLDPVSVRARSNSEAWVVNHISDSISIVDLATLRVRATLRTQDEPCDVVFAGSAGRAFVSCSQANSIQVFDPANLGTAPTTLAIFGEDPRALAVSPDGSTVYAAIFESGNNTTVLGGGAAGGGTIGFPPNVVNDVSGPYAGVNPPPNAGTGFVPAIAPANNPAIKVSLIVKKDAAGTWMDDNGGDWTNLVSGPGAATSGRVVGWDLADHDVAIIDADSLSLSYARGLMNICMALAVNPASGAITVVGTDGTNEIRYEPNLTGHFLRVNLALVDPLTPNAATIVDLNPHLNYADETIPQTERDKSIGDPRAIVWNAAGSRGYVAGLGSNNVTVIDSDGNRAGLAETIDVGEGAAGLALDESRARLYVLNRFAGTISVVDTVSETVLSTPAFFDPTPAAIKLGRKHLYDTRKNSGLGHIACASCHVDGRNDRLAWDLGDPSGASIALTDRNLGFGLLGLAPPFTAPAFAPFHPMKGPMTTQTLQDIVGHEPFHWRGDRLGIEEFAGAFIGLQGDDTTLTETEMQEFEDFLATITFPPNPFRNFDNTLPTSLPLVGHFTTGRFAAAGAPLPNGDANAGMTIYRSTTRRLDGGAFACVTCHTLPTGTGPDYTLVGATYQPMAAGPDGERHHGLVSVDGVTNVSMKIPQLRNEYEKTGFNTTQLLNTAGFGVLHDGSVDSIERFVAEPVFNVVSDQEIANLTAFMLAFSGSDLPLTGTNVALQPPGTLSKDSRAAVGRQTTMLDATSAPVDQILLILSMVTQADLGKVGVIAKGVVDGVPRGYAYAGGGVFQSDLAAETETTTNMLLLAIPGGEVTFTVVPLGSETRLGIDRDEDGFYDRDELAGCSDPADPLDVPDGNGLDGDLNGDGVVDLSDLGTILADYGCVGSCVADIDQDGDVDLSDLGVVLAAYGTHCPM